MSRSKCRLLVIGGSAGALEAIVRFLPDIDLSEDFAIVIVLHRKESKKSSLEKVLQDKTDWPVKEAADKEKIGNGIIYLAPVDYHLLIENDCTFALDASEKINFSRPGIDATFESAAMAMGKNVVCLLLSGANADGSAGLLAAKKYGAFIAVQDPADALVDYMPALALQLDKEIRKLKSSRMAGFINSLNPNKAGD